MVLEGRGGEGTYLHHQWHLRLILLNSLVDASQYPSSNDVTEQQGDESFFLGGKEKRHKRALGCDDLPASPMALKIDDIFRLLVWVSLTAPRSVAAQQFGLGTFCGDMR
jgi:hypothetical protein